MELKLDFHVHSYYSADSVITPQDLTSCGKKQGLDGFGITDHDCLEGSLRIAEQTDLLIIPGMEVASQQGHITALNVQTKVPSGLSLEKTVERIHEAEGIAIACHPFGLFKGGLGKHVTSQFDAVEVVNASAFPFARSVRLGLEIAEKCGISRIAGSDAHLAPEIGYAYTSVTTDAKDAEHIVEAIKKGLCKPFGSPIPITLRLKKQISVRLNRRNRRRDARLNALDSGRYSN